MDDQKLPGKRQRFVDEYLVDLNATRAAKVAGYSAKTARSQGQRLLTNADVAAAITQGRAAQASRAGIRQDDVLRELGRLAFGDIRKLLDAKGNLLPAAEWPDDMAPTVASIEVLRETTRFLGRKKNRTTVHEQVLKLRFWDKPRALDMLGRHLQLFKEVGDPERPLHALVKKVNVVFNTRKPEAPK